MRQHSCWSIAGICVLLAWAFWLWKPSVPNSTMQIPRPVPSNKLEKPPEARQAVQRSKLDRPSPIRMLAAYGKLPLSFEVNQGQTNSAVKSLSRGSGYTLFLTGDEAVLGLRRHDPKLETRNSKFGMMNRRFDVWNPEFATRSSKFGTRNSEFEAEIPGSLPAGLESPISNLESPIFSLKSPISDDPSPAPSTLRMKLVGANPNAVATGGDELPGKTNYFIGNNPKKWRTNVPTYAKVKYKGVYPGIDLVYYGNQGGRLEYDFVVAPGANPNVIAFDVGVGSPRRLPAQG